MQPSPNALTFSHLKLDLTLLFYTLISSRPRHWENTIEMEPSPAPQRRAYARMTTIAMPSGIQYVLQPYQHHPGELTTQATATFSKDELDWSRQQKKAMYEFRTDAFEAMKLSQLNEVSMNDRIPSLVPSTLAMRRIIKHFSNIFFLGSLGNVKFEWNALFCSHCDAVGMAHHYRSTNQHAIFLHPKLCLGLGRDTGPRILSVLLHECCHTFLSRNCCCNHTVACPEECRSDQRHHIGATGHGVAWVRLATHVQAIAKRYINESIDLGIEIGMCTELASTARDQFTDETEMAGCHVESQAMLARFRLLAGIPLEELLRHISKRQAAERGERRA